MKISSRRDYLINLESVAMTDIVLNMFIFFFISFSLLYTFGGNQVKQLDIKLPGARNVAPGKITNPVNITISNEGILRFNEEPVTGKELKEKVIALVKKNPEIAVMLYSDKLTPFKEVVRVLDVLTESGVRNLNIAAIMEKAVNEK